MEVFAVNRSATYVEKEGFNNDAQINIPALPFSGDKLKYIYDYPYQVNKLELLFPVFKFHGRWDELNISEFAVLKKQRLVSKGWELFWNREEDMPVDKLFHPLYYYSESDNLMEYESVTEKEKLDKITLSYLNQIVSLTKEHNIDLYFVAAPYSMSEQEAAKFHALKEYADEKEIQFFDFNDSSIIQELQLTFEDMVDYQHVNTQGALKITH